MKKLITLSIVFAMAAPLASALASYDFSLFQQAMIERAVKKEKTLEKRNLLKQNQENRKEGKRIKEAAEKAAREAKNKARHSPNR